MKKNLIFRLLQLILFSILFHSCIHNETLAASDPASHSKEYTNKSLWKEDEKYIKNVRKVFDTYADKNYFSAHSGEVYWDYALTMGTFDESFLEVPVVKSGKINYILVVNREKDRVYFKRKEDKDSKDFFNVLVFKDRNQLTGRIVEDPSAVGTIQNKGQICYMVEVRWTWTNADGSPGETFVYHHMRCTFVGPALPTDDIYPGGGGPGGDSGGGGGYPYPGTTKDPCGNIVSNNNSAKILLSKTEISGKKAQLTSTVSTDAKEKSFLFGVKADGSYAASSVEEGTTYTAPMEPTHPDFKVNGGAHTHTAKVYNISSPGDIYVFARNNIINPDFKYLYTFANDNVGYVLTITDPERFENLYTNYPTGTYFDPKTQNWNATSSIGIDYRDVLDFFEKQGKSVDESMELAMAFVIGKYDMGVGLSKMDTSGNFIPLFVKETPDPANPMKKVYEKTAECNLK